MKRLFFEVVRSCVDAPPISLFGLVDALLNSCYHERVVNQKPYEIRQDFNNQRKVPNGVPQYLGVWNLSGK